MIPTPYDDRPAGHAGDDYYFSLKANAVYFTSNDKNLKHCVQSCGGQTVLAV